MKFNIIELNNNIIQKILLNKLQENEIQLWVIDWRKTANEVRIEILSEDEVIYVNKFRKYEDKMRSLTAWYFVRNFIKHNTDVNFSDIKFRREHNGKPVLINFPEIKFNISHSADIVVIAISYRINVGVDVEKIIDMNYTDISDHFFTKEESSIITDIKSFYCFWTAKEAYIKAIGEGLYKNLDTFDVVSDYVNDKSKSDLLWKIEHIFYNEIYAISLVYNEKEGKDVQKI